MLLVFDYILKLSIGLAVVYLFYHLVLRKLTHYNWNRLYLVGFSVLCFCIPFINIQALLEKNELGQAGLISFIPSVNTYTDTFVQVTQCPVPGTGWDKWDWMAIVFITGIIILLARFFMRLVSFVMMRGNAELLFQNGMKLYQVNQPIRPFSFGNAIFINRQMHSDNELQEIICHEFVHVKQRHTFDIIMGEILCILNWYNPFAWLIRKAIRQNLEFIADQQVLQTGFDRKRYQYLLLKVVGVSAYSIANNFNFSSLKKRIAMMNKTKSGKKHLMRFLFIVPLLVIVLVAFRNTRQQGNDTDNNSNTITIQADTLPSNVKSIQSRNERVRVQLKNGTVERYDLSVPKEKEAFESKYGPLPDPPPPPPPMVEGAVVNVPPPPPAPYAQDCYNKKGYCITIADNNGECVVIVKDKKKKIVEAVALTDWNKDNKYEDKYGKLPDAPPPAPPTAPTPPLKETGVSAGVSSTKPMAVQGVQVTTGSGVQAVSINGAVSQPAGVAVQTAEVKQTPGRVSVGSGGIVTPVEAEREGNIIAVIKSSTTREQLEQLKKDLAKKGYTLKITNVNYNDGKLVSIKGTITNGERNGSFHGEDFNSIVISYIDNNRGSGFNIGIHSGSGKIAI